MSQSPTGKPNIKSLMAELELDDEDTLDDGSISDPETEEGKKKAADAFARQRKALKAAKGVIGSLLERVESLESAGAGSGGGGRVEGGVAGVEDAVLRGEMLEAQLINQAMQRTQIAKPDHPIVIREANYLYAQYRQMLENQASAKEKAPSVFDKVISEFDNLDDEDKTAIRESVSKVDVVSQANEDFIRSEAYRYVGKNLKKFTAPVSKPPKDKPPATDPAAISRIKSRGVEPADAGSGGGGDEKPATAEEVKLMKSVGLNPKDPSSLATYRKAARKKASYQES